MSKIRTWRTWRTMVPPTLVVGTIMLVGCGGSDHVAGPTGAPLVVSASVEPVRSSGEPFQITVSIKNPNVVKTTWYCSDGCPISYEVADASGRTIAQAAASCTEAASTLDLEPGQIKQLILEWDGSFIASGHRDPAPSGRYAVVAGLRRGGMNIDVPDTVFVSWMEGS